MYCPEFKFNRGIFGAQGSFVGLCQHRRIGADDERTRYGSFRGRHFRSLEANLTLASVAYSMGGRRPAYSTSRSCECIANVRFLIADAAKGKCRMGTAWPLPVFASSPVIVSSPLVTCRSATDGSIQHRPNLTQEQFQFLLESSSAA